MDHDGAGCFALESSTWRSAKRQWFIERIRRKVRESL
jgi:hypothetical protein